MQTSKIQEIMDDSIIHLSNIIELMLNRKILLPTNVPSFVQQFEDQKQNGVVSIQLIYPAQEPVYGSQMSQIDQPIASFSSKQQLNDQYMAQRNTKQINKELAQTGNNRSYSDNSKLQTEFIGYGKKEIQSANNTLSVIQDQTNKHHQFMQEFCTITQGLNYNINKIHFMYIFPIMNKHINTAFKKAVESDEFDTLLVFADEQCIKSLKKIIIKEDANRKGNQKPYIPKRIDLIHFDNVLINMLKNAHSSHYSIITQEELKSLYLLTHINPLFLHKVYVNDPVILYYGFNPFTVIQEHFLSDITSGLSTQYLLVIPVSSEYDINTQFVYYI